MSRIKCVIIDDELPGLSYLRMLCEQFSFVEIVKCFDSPQYFIEEIQNMSFDVCFLDINMPGMNGLEVAKKIEGKYVIFVSAHPEFAVDAYDLEAIDFIKKPVVKERLEKALKKAYKLIVDKPTMKEYFNWNTNLGKSIIFFDEINYTSTSGVDKRDKMIYMNDDSILLLKNITVEKLMSFLPADQFIQINKSEIISKKSVLAHSANEIVLKTKDSFSKKISLLLGDVFRKSFTDWIG
jgi:DNA-binding LytR/AlgR family response regulator